MNPKRVLIWMGVSFLVVISCAVFSFRARYCRTITLTDLSKGQTQTVSVAFMPHEVDWKVSGNVEGSGFLMLSYVYSNRVSGEFSFSGRGDYYESNAAAVFIPEGPATGKIRVSFRFNNWY